MSMRSRAGILNVLIPTVAVSPIVPDNLLGAFHAVAVRKKRVVSPWRLRSESCWTRDAGMASIIVFVLSFLAVAALSVGPGFTSRTGAARTDFNEPDNTNEPDQAHPFLL